MNNDVFKTGYWASLIAIVSFIAYTICFIAILLVNPFYTWTNFAEYIDSVQTTNQLFKHIAMFFMIMYGVCFVLQLCSIEEIAEPMNKFYAKIAKLFGLGFFVLISINYFIQLSSVRIQISIREMKGLEQFVQENPISVISAINMLGWTIFFGLACIFVALAFNDRKTGKVIRRAFIANGIIMFLGAGGYILNIAVIVFLCMYLGLGTAILTATIPLCWLFKKYKNTKCFLT